MSFVHRDLDTDIDRLVKESPLAKGLHYEESDLPYPVNKSYISLTRPIAPVSSSATARLKRFSSASPVPKFNAFRSPQVQLRRINDSTQSIADLFNSLKKGTADNESNTSVSVGNHAPRKVPVRSKGIRDFQETFEDCFDSEPSEANQSTLDTEATGADDTSSDPNIEACSLFMWIIKPVPGVAAVRVEGKRSLTENEFWQSGIITRRINEKVVETKNGSVYRLEGNMELLDAIAAGVTRAVAEAFWLGFPDDWQQLIEEHLFNGKYTREPRDDLQERSSEEEDGICVVEACDDDDQFNTEESCQDETDNTGTELSEETVEDAADLHHSDGNTLVSDNGSVDPEQPKIIKPREKKQTGRANECVLTNWIIQPLPIGGGVHLLGLNQEGVMWNSSAIERRLEKRKLLTSSGVVYKLKGNMDRLLALQQGIPEKIIEKFKTGFPKEWQELLQEIIVEGNLKRQTKSKTTQRVKSTKTASHTRKKTDSTPENKATTKRKAVSEKIIRNVKPLINNTDAKGSRNKKGLSSTVVHSRNTSLNSTVSDCDKPKNVVITPIGGIVDLENLQHSRSGRLIKPPLSWWAGQTICQGKDGYFVRARTEYAHRYCQEIEDRVWNSGKRFRNSFFKQRRRPEDQNMFKEKSASYKRVESKKIDRVALAEDKTENEGTAKEKHSSKKRLDNKKMNIKTFRVAQAGQDRIESESLTTNVVKLETSAESNQSEFQEDSYPDLEKEIRIVLKRSRLSGRRNSVKKLVSPCYRSCIEKKQNSSQDKELYSFEESDDSNCMDGKTMEGAEKKIVSTRKKPVKLNQVSIVSSTTGEQVEGVEPSPRRTRSSSRRSCTQTESAEEMPDLTVRESCDKSLRKRRGSKIPDISVNDKIVGNANQAAPKVQATRKRKSSEQNSLDRTADDGCTDNWSVAERDRLNLAFKRISGLEKDYWDKVAEFVRSRTADECCQEFYKTEKVQSTKKRKQSKPTEKLKTVGLTANRGTLKRKQQFHDILKQHSENHKDNLFDGTPFRKARKEKVRRVAELEGEDFFEESSKRQGKSRFQTPKGDIEVGRRVMPQFASAKKTPLSNVNMEEMNERENVNSYVHGMLKRRLHLNKRPKKLVTPTHKKAPLMTDENYPHQKLFQEFIHQQLSDDENHEESELEQDYYWEET